MSSKEITFLVEDDPEGGYTARGLEYSIFTDGEDLGELKENINDAVRCHFGSPEEIFPVIRFRDSVTGEN